MSFSHCLLKENVTIGDEDQNAKRGPSSQHFIGKVQKFIVGSDFESYSEQLEFYSVSNGITDADQKKAGLLTNLPTETYQLVKDLVAPSLLKESTTT